MKILKHALIIAVAAVVGWAAGFAWRGRVAARANADVHQRTLSRSHDSATNTSRAMKRMAVRPAIDASPLATQLARDLAISAGVARWLFWMEAIERARLTDFPRLARLAKGDVMATRLLASRWVELDLRNLFDAVAAAQDRSGFPIDELAAILFDEWPRRDPDAAIAALSGTNAFGTRDTWRLHVAALLIEKDPERGLRALSSWGIQNFAPRMNGVARWAAANPRHAAEVALVNPTGYASRMVLETIGGEWAKIDPVRAMEFASGTPGESGETLGSQVLKKWAERNREVAAGWLAALDNPTRARFGAGFVEAWACSDPNGALAWCETNLAGAGLAQAVGGVMKTLVQSNLVAAAAFVAEMKPSSARAEAAAVVAKKWFPGSLSGASVPPAAIGWLTTLDARSAKRALEEVQWKWSICDPRSMAEFLVSSGADRVSAVADTNVARALARQNPAEALSWAARLPAQRALAAGGEAFAEWRRAQPESAVRWLEQLPSTDLRREPFLTLSLH